MNPRPRIKRAYKTRWLCVVVLQASLGNAQDQNGKAPSGTAEAITRKAEHLMQAYEDISDGPAQQLVFEFDHAKRQSIDFFPLRAHTHAGATIGLMKESPVLATHDLLREVLSEEGYLRVQAIQSLEDVWGAPSLQSAPGTKLSDAYAIQLFGNPGGEGPLGIKYEGHHVSVNVTVSEGAVRGTPLFLGANPAEITEGPRKGLRAMAPQQDHARALLNSLNDKQRDEAFRPDVKSGIRRGGLPEIVQQTGVSAEDLAPEQRNLLFATIRSYAEMLHPSMAADEMKRIELAGLENVSFMWKGSTMPDQEHYYRIQGPSVLIEFQTRDGIHLHSLWRDPQRDFGNDLLQEMIEHHHATP